jgi:polyhydroxyalkanoate synthesis regulator phasin
MADVRAAMVAAGQELLDQAVADGLVTPEQADRFRQHIVGHGAGRCGRAPFGEVEHFGAYRERLGEAFAAALDMDVEDLRAAIADGQTPCEIVEAQGRDPAEVWEATESARQDLLQQAVDDALMTQEQADRIGEHLANFNPGDWCEESGFGPGIRGPGMRGMKRGFHGFRVVLGVTDQ